MEETEYDYVCTDVETTGLNHESDEIIEVFAAEFNLSGEVGRTIHYMCCPMSGYISPKASHINGITIDMVQGKPYYLKDKIQLKVAEFFGNRIVIGHNLINFDIKFLKINPKKMEDTLLMCRKRYSGRNNLKNACKRMGIPWSEADAHSADYDALQTIRLYCAILKEDKGVPSDEKQVDLFKNLPGATDKELKNLGVIPSARDKEMMATQAYSFSRINLFEQCPFKWYMQYIRKVPQPDEPYFKTGKICHSVAEWSAAWCCRQTFINKFSRYADEYVTVGIDSVISVIKESSEKLGKEFKSIEDVGAYLYDNQREIKKFNPKMAGIASMISEIDSKISRDSYEHPSMPGHEVYEQFIQEAINRYRCDDIDVIKESRRIMNKFYEMKDFSLEPGDITITEKRLTFDKNWKTLKDFFANDAFFRGVIDVIDYFGNYIIITDYKTSRKMIKDEDIAEDKQLLTYLLLVYMFLPKDAYESITVRIEYLRFGRSVEHCFTNVKQAAEKALKWINDSIQKIEKEMVKTDGTAFPPIRNEYCHKCHLGEDGTCPLFDKEVADIIDDPFNCHLSTIADCQKAWKRVEVNKAENSKLMSKCKSFVTHCEDPISIDENAKLDFWVEESKDVDTVKAAKLLLEKDVDMNYILRFANLTEKSIIALCESKEMNLTEEEWSSISKIKRAKKFDAFTEKEAKGKYLNA